MFSSKDLFFTPTSGAYTVSKSLRFRASATAYLNRTFSTPTNVDKWTFSAWIKRTLPGTNNTIFSANTNFYQITYDSSTDTIQVGTSSNYTVTNAKFRDPSAWGHVIVTFDSSLAATSRCKIYFNGSECSYSSQGFQTNTVINSAIAHYIGRQGVNANYLDGYLAEVNFIDGSALTPSSFGAYDTNGVWQPATYTGTYGTNGFYLKFTDVGATSGSNTGYGQDFSGNGNYWTTNNLSSTAGTTYDSMLDSPTNATGDIGNYCTLNPLDSGGPTTNIVNANLQLNSGTDGSVRSTFWISPSDTQGYYFEMQSTTLSTSGSTGGGVGSAQKFLTNSVGWTTSGWDAAGFIKRGSGGGDKWNWYSANVGGGGLSDQDTGIVAATTDILQVAIKNGKVWLGINNTWQNSGSPTGGTGQIITATNSISPFLIASTTGTMVVNSGQRPFTYTPPSGFSALNTQNLTTPTITNGAQYMAATTYTGAGSTQAITNGGNNNAGTTFQPDFVWIKNRGAAWNNNLYDVIRGTGKALFSDLTDAEATNSIYGYLSAFSASGFSATAGTTSGNLTNQSSSTYVAWQWKAGGSSVVNNVGTIQSTVSANTTAGFSVVTYTGTGANATVGHGLGVAPSMIIVKNRTSALNWIVYTATTGAGNVLFLDATNASTANTTAFNNTSPTSSVFSVGANNNTNQSTNNLVAYCFAPVAGYSAFGSYTGNGSTDGPFVYTGFRPRFIMVKRTDTAGNNWRIWDTSRATYNAGLPVLYPNTSDAEDSVTDTYDILSNGFKLRGSGAGANASGGTFIYAAFAENPFKISRAR